MKTMIWKELRENIKWALLAFLALLLAEIYVLSSEQKSFQGNNFEGFTLCGSAFLMVTSFGCSAVGAALGVVQILPELRCDQWAALLHRPVSRGVIFLGKAAAGLLLCFAATGLPLLASIWFVAAPGKFPAPLVPGMILPGLSDLLLGPVFYFAALLACLQRGKWFGLKGLIVLSIVPVFWLHTSSDCGFLVLPLVAAAILMLAAWGAILGNGPVQNEPAPGRLALVIVAVAGAQTALLLLATGARSLAGKKSLLSFDFAAFEVTLDGRVFQSRQRGDGTGMVVTDMDGKEVTDERYLGNNSYDYFCNFAYLGFDLKTDAFPEKSELHRYPRNMQNYLMPVEGLSYDAPEIWYLLVGEKYLVGYDQLSRRKVGFFDRDGFKLPGTKPAPFSVPLRYVWYSNYNPILMIAGPQVFAFDFPERNMTPFFKAPGGRILETSTFSSKYGSPNKVAIALENEIRIFDNKGNQLMAIPYPHNPEQWDALRITTNKAFDHIYLESRSDYPWIQSGSHQIVLPTYLDEYDLHGNLLHSYSLPPGKNVEAPLRWVNRMIDYSLPWGAVVAARIWSDPESFVRSLGESFTVLPDFQSINLAALSLVALSFAAIAFAWSRKTGFSTGASLGWSVFVFVFGPAGLVAFRLVAGWPMLVRCPSCGQKRAIENERCGGCDQAWDLPERNGTEILDASVLQQP